MAYVEAHAGLRDHLKTKKVARLLGIPKVQVIGHMCLQSSALCAMMFSSEQVLETHGIADTTGVFLCPKQLHTCSAQGAPFIDHAMRVTPVLATWVSSLDERRTLRVQKQEMHPMTAKRKSLSKGLRFDIFKRDGFTCQYCGQKPPDVVLQVDHIRPVAAGGTNDILNLVTSCEACNQGKKAKRLNITPRPDADIAWLEMQQELAELQRYQRAKAERDQLVHQIISALQETWVRVSGLDWYPAEHVLQQMILKYSPDLVEEAIGVVAPKAAGGYVGKDWLRYMHGVLKNLAGDSQATE